MRNLVVHMSKITSGVTQASVKVAKLLAQELKCEILERENDALTAPYDNVFIVNSPSAFCGFLDQLVSICKMSNRLIWVMQDYTVYPPTQLREYLYGSKRKMELWGTLPTLPEAYRDRKTYGNINFKADHVINWNALGYSYRNMVQPDKEGIIYWGAFRVMPSHTTDRWGDFSRYLLGSTVEYPVTISTSAKSIEKFQNEIENDHVTVIGPFDNLITDIQAWPATVYIEDVLSHRTFCQPANRFYEALGAGIAIFFDRDSVRTMSMAGFNVKDDWIVNNANGVRRLLPMAGAIAVEQREEWDMDYNAQMIDHLEVLLETVR